jgi:integrase/recombinase XerD
MSDLAPLLQGFFTDKLMLQLQASQHTIAAYRDTFTLLLGFAEQRTGRPPARLSIADLDAPTIGAFLQHLETVRGNTAATRNVRLAAVRSLFRYAALRAPEHAAVIQRVLAIPPKRFDSTGPSSTT